MSPRKPNKKSRPKPGKPRVQRDSGPLPVARELLTAGIDLDPEEDMKRQIRLEGVKAALLSKWMTRRQMPPGPQSQTARHQLPPKRSASASDP